MMGLGRMWEFACLARRRDGRGPSIAGRKDLVSEIET